MSWKILSCMMHPWTCAFLCSVDDLLQGWSWVTCQGCQESRKATRQVTLACFLSCHIVIIFCDVCMNSYGLLKWCYPGPSWTSNFIYSMKYCFLVEMMIYIWRMHMLFDADLFFLSQNVLFFCTEISQFSVTFQSIFGKFSGEIQITVSVIWPNWKLCQLIFFSLFPSITSPS